MRRDGAANREKVLLAAEHVFAEKGAAASTDEVARRAGVSIATVFRNFATKQDLIEATAVRHLEKLTAEALRLADSRDAGQAFASLMKTLAAAGPVKMTLLDLLPPHDGREGLSRPVTEAADAFRAALDGALHRAQAAGAARPEVTGDDVSLLLRALAHATDLGEGEALDRVVGIVLDGLGVPR
ncbi:TetR family transcriptional regulator [Streptomyces sp. CB02923]|uniref:TetR/AcrR family transcriptional regulator n=1 Tax=Streptomyces sp. CB02923 TaxID=1718985 RepID=UPI00093E3C78|nr:TetR/AcrR family transcriptional regulator [Streptomyces sp. CB02923]OKI02168.1 TetR family transcriptional regulator [Streptomyces sp. CB02923]